MNTTCIKVDPLQPDEGVLLTASRLLKEGKLVAFPTETVYGLGANALDPEAAEKTYQAKGRPSDNPLIVHISDFKDIALLVEEIPTALAELARVFWPGPLTVICRKSDVIPSGVTGGLDTVAIRMPNHPIALALIRLSGGYISAPSANSSGRPSPTKASHVMTDLNGKIEMVIDGGEVEIGLESTILDMTVVPPRILRPGAITREMLENVLGEVEVDKALVGDSKAPPKAPGMKYRHYSPKAPLFLISGDKEQIPLAINRLIQEGLQLGKKVGVLATEETKNFYQSCVIRSLGSEKSVETIAHNLYNSLREFDEKDVDIIFGETFYVEGLFSAIMNRLQKAASHRNIEASNILSEKENYLINLIITEEETQNEQC